MRVEAIRSPATRETVARALVCAWWRLLQEAPTHDGIMLLTAQSAFECGWWKSCWNNNIGNAKSHQKDGDWYFIECSELLDPARAEALKTADPLRVLLGASVNIAKPGEPPKKRRAVTFYPDHPACCFRAHATLADGVEDHVRMMFDNFESAMSHIKAGDVSAAVAALAGRYFTDDPRHYEYVWRDCLRQLGDLDIDLSPQPESALAVTPFSLQTLSQDIIGKEFTSGGIEADEEAGDVPGTVDGAGPEDSGGNS